MILKTRTTLFLATGLALLPLAACRHSDFPQYPPDYREYAYVTNGGSGTVSAIDVVNIRVDREIAVGMNPVAVAPSPTRNEVYVVNQGPENGSGSLAVLNAENNSLAALIPVHRQPSALDVDADGDSVWVANAGSNSVSLVDLRSRHEVAQIGVGEEPVALRLTPDGKTLVVANRHSNSVSILDTASRRLRAAFDGCPGAGDVTILPDSSKAFIACTGGHQILAVSLAHAQSAKNPAPSHPDRVESLLDVGHAPQQLALKPDGGELFSLNSGSNTISEVITGTNDVNSSILMGDGPARGLVTADNSLMYVSNQHSQEVTIYAIDDGKRRQAIHVGDGPGAMAFSTAGHLLLVADSRSNDVAVVRTSSHSLFNLLQAGRGPNAIAIKAFRQK
jgi:YVTN family beta-propeller protein